MEMAILRSVSKTFHGDTGEVKVLDDLDLTIEKGDFFSLLGPSGCGKTTIIRCIAGLETPDSGEIIIGGKTVFSSEKKINIPPHRRGIGMVFQSYAVWPHMTVAENVAFPLRHDSRRKWSAAEIRERVADALHLVKLDGYGDRPAPMLSGGQQQRVALARAIVARPEIILLDEPLSNLDAKLRQETRNELRQLFQTLGATAVFVTHDQAEAFAVSDRVAVMQGGRLQQLADPEHVYRRPVSSFVADFVGRINFIDGVTAECDGKTGAETPIGFVACGRPTNIGLGEHVRLGIRPEHVRIDAAEGENCFSAILVAKVFLGDCYDCRVAVGDCAFDLKLSSADRTAVGERVELAFPRDDWMVLKK